MDPLNNIEKIFSQPTLLIKVGPEETEYHIHKYLATEQSEYFRCATLPDCFIEGETGIITLRDVEPPTFEAFVFWLYRHKIQKSLDPGFSRTLTLLYVFADRFLVPTLKNAIIEEFTLLANGHISLPHYNTIVYAFENLPQASPFLQLLADIHCKFWHGDEANAMELLELPPEFLSKVLKTYATLSRSTLVLNAASYKERSLNDSETHETKLNGSKFKELESQVNRVSYGAI